LREGNTRGTWNKHKKAEKTENDLGTGLRSGKGKFRGETRGDDKEGGHKAPILVYPETPVKKREKNNKNRDLKTGVKGERLFVGGCPTRGQNERGKKNPPPETRTPNRGGVGVTREVTNRES